MQVSVEEVSSVKKVLHIEIPEEEVTRELDNAYKELGKTAKVKGFRPGKVPRSVLERLYKKNVTAEISSKLIQESFEAAIKENDLRYIGNPLIDPPELEAKQPYKYDVTIEQAPEIEDIDFKGLTIKKNIYTVTDNAVEEQLEKLRRAMTQQKPLEEERPVREGDLALIDFEGFKDGKPFAETQKTENFLMKVGANQITKDFDEQLAGMNPGESREINISFPESYPSEKLANLDITFQVTLREIKEEILPDVDDELAKRFGKQTLDELKNEIISDLKQGYEKRTEQEQAEQIFEMLLEKTDFEVPDVMIGYELEGILSEIDRSLSYQNTSLEEQGLTREKLSEKYRDTAVKQSKRRLILNKLIEQEKVTVSDEEVENALKEMSEAIGKTPAEMRNHYKQNEDEFGYFKHALLEKQVIRLIVENSTIVEEEVQPE